ncbi:hypothetical protein AVEN_862-1, partial [Araneus ventricosus]
VMYENPPPPSDFFEDDFELVSFIYPRPQSVKLDSDMKFIKIDRSLIHRALFGCEEKEKEQTSEVSVNKNALEKGIGKSKISKENLVKNGALEKTKIKCAISQKDESAVFPEKNKERKQKNRSKEEKKNDINSDDSKNGKKKKTLVAKSSSLQSIFKSYSMSESDSDNSEKHRTKSSSRHAKSHSKKSSRRRRKDKDHRNDTSYSDVIPYDKVGSRSTEFSVKREIISSDEESFSSSFSKKAEITVKEEVLCDKDYYKKDKIKSSKSSKKIYDDTRNHDDSRNRFDDSRSRDD